MPTVIIYTTPTCAYCHLEKEWFKQNNIEFTEKDLTTDSEAYNEVMQKVGQAVTPITDIDGEIIIGFDRAKLAAKLGIK